MTVYIAFAVTPNPVKVGEKVYFFGNVNEDGVPLVSYNVQIYDIATETRLFDLMTDANGDFVAEFVAVESHIGSYDVAAYVPIYEGLWSDVVTLVITNEIDGDGMPLKVLAGLSLLGLFGMFVVTRRKR